MLDSTEYCQAATVVSSLAAVEMLHNDNVSLVKYYQAATVVSSLAALEMLHNDNVRHGCHTKCLLLYDNAMLLYSYFFLSFQETKWRKKETHAYFTKVWYKCIC